MMRIKKAPQRFWKDNEWRMRHATELQEKYRNEWVAIVNESVVAHGKDPAELRQIAREKTRVKGDILVDFVEGDAHIY